MNTENLLDEVMHLTESMYVAAMSAEWDELIVFQERQAWLIQQDAFKLAAISHRDLLEKISELTHLVTDMAESQRTELYQAIMQLKKCDSAQNAYLQNTGDQVDF